MADGTTPSKVWKARVPIAKVDAAQHLVYGWLYVTKKADGTEVVDHSGETCPIELLEKASIKFALKHRATTEMHRRTCMKCSVVNEIEAVRADKCTGCKRALSKFGQPTAVGQLVEIICFTAEKRKALGIPDGCVHDGTWVGFYVPDGPAWDGVVSGKYKMLSFGGFQSVKDLVEAT